MNNRLKNTVKFAVVTCFTLGAVAVAASADKIVANEIETSPADFEN